MEKTECDSAYLEEVARAIDDTTLSCIDFDKLKQHLVVAADRLRSTTALAESQARLRDDYEKRIAGMIKAVAAVGRKRDGWEEAAALVDQLPTVTVDRLLEIYRRVSARFRDSFPGSFGLIRK